MNKTNKLLISISFFLFSIVFIIQLLTTRALFNHYIFDNLRSFAYKLNNEFPTTKTTNSYIDTINYKLDDSSSFIYEVTIKLKTNYELEKIKINNSYLPVEKTNDVKVYSFILAPNFFIIETEQTYTIQEFVSVHKTIPIYFNFTIYKDIDFNTILEKEKSIVGVSLGRTWGSGIIIEKNKTTKTNIFGKEKSVYEYLILTAQHVVKRNLKISIHYNNTYNTYGDVKILGVYTDNSDLALLKLTTKDGSLIPLDDQQFINNESIDYNVGDTVFSIGSPMNKKIAFNAVSSGVIINKNEQIMLKEERRLAIKTTATLGSGSSGGALFDKNGNLIGLNFAGDSNNNYGFAVPIEIILQAKNIILTSTSFHLISHKKTSTKKVDVF